jgi:hypothetical protein
MLSSYVGGSQTSQNLQCVGSRWSRLEKVHLVCTIPDTLSSALHRSYICSSISTSSTENDQYVNIQLLVTTWRKLRKLLVWIIEDWFPVRQKGKRALCGKVGGLELDKEVSAIQNPIQSTSLPYHTVPASHRRRRGLDIDCHVC